MPLTMEDGVVNFQKFLDETMDAIKTRQSYNCFFNEYLGIPSCSKTYKFNRKARKMNYGLDTKAIEKRFSEAMIVGWGNGHIAILLPTRDGFVNIVTGAAWKEISSATSKWTICKGDKCIVGRSKYERTCMGFSGIISHPFRTINNEGHCANWESIRPIPQLTETQKAIQELEDSIEIVKAEITELKKLEGM